MKKWVDVMLYLLPRVLIVEILLTAIVATISALEIIFLSGKFPDWSLLVFAFLGVTSVVQLVACFYVLHFHTKLV